jgi:signal transduction histidine kinase
VTPTADPTRTGARTAWPHRLTARIPRLPPETRAVPLTYSPALIAYVVALATGAVTAAALTVRLPANPALLALGACATFLLAATSVRALSGTASHWSASIFAHMGLAFVAGPIGALVAVASEFGGAKVRFGGHWFKNIFNASDQFLSDLTAWGVFRGITGGRISLGPGLVGGLAAGMLCWLVNIGLLAIVQRLTHRGLKVLPYVGQNAASVLPYHLGAGLTAFGGVVLVDAEGADGFLLLLVPVLLLQMSLLALSARTHAAQLQREADAKEKELLLRRALEASEAERHRIARNLHDGVVQDLAAVARGLRARAAPGEAGQTMRHAADATAEAMDELRTLLREIAPPDLEEIGLAAALGDLADPLRDLGIEVTIEIAESAGDIRGTALNATYRITQEALHNVDQHAQARHVEVAVTRDDGRLDLRIVDDGVGFTAERRHQQVAAGHLGLSLIHDLAREAGGDLEIRSVPDAGTTVHAQLPADEDGAVPGPGNGQAAGAPS